VEKDSCQTRNKNCVLSRNGFQPYQRCDYCSLKAHQCMGMQQNFFVFIITFFAAMFIYIENPLLIKTNLVVVVGLLFWLGIKITVNTDQLAQKESENHALNLKLQNYNTSLEKEVKKRTNQLTRVAEMDSITGLMNRSSFDKELEILLDKSKEDETEHVLVYLDLDQFKIVNDTCGHSAGDELLRQIGILMKKRVRDVDLLARLGGDEFGIVFVNTDLKIAEALSKRLLSAIGEYRFFWQGKIFSIGASLGLVEIRKECCTFSDLISRADAACYAAKDEGRNRIHIAKIDDVNLAARKEQMQWISRLELALKEDMFELYVQPIVDLKNSKSIKHYEVLVRLRENDELIPPMAFIPAAERYGFINKLDMWVVKNALSKASKLLINSKKTSFSINLSGASLSNGNFVEYIKEQFLLYHVPYELITFEITETAAITSLKVAQDFMKTFRDLGCKFALDDFGCGLSSFSYLQNLEVDFLKIDGSFVIDIDENIINKSMVESINSIGHVMQIKTVCEYVETQSVLDMLKSMGVDYAQGYFTGRPVPISKL